MTADITSIDAYLPHVTISSKSGNQHVIPVQFFEDICSGKACITNLDGFEEVVPTIISEWLKATKKG